MNNRAFSHPILVVMVATLVILLGAFWLDANQVNLSSSKNVRGVSVNKDYAEPGMGVVVVASNSNWNLVKYLCETIDECLLSLTSGTKLGTVSGGTTDYHEVVISSAEDWVDYSYIKYYVQPNWYADTNVFSVSNLGDYPGSEIYTLRGEGKTYEVVISPIENVTSNYYKSATFSD